MWPFVFRLNQLGQRRVRANQTPIQPVETNNFFFLNVQCLYSSCRIPEQKYNIVVMIK